MYTGGCAVHSTAALPLRSELSSFTQSRLCCTGDAAEAEDCCSTGYLSSPSSAFFARKLSHGPAFLYSRYYLTRRPIFLYRLANPASYVTRIYGRWEAGCRERTLNGFAARRADASSGRRPFSCCCTIGAWSGRDAVCSCRGLLEDAGELEDLEWEEEETGCCCGRDTALNCGYCNLTFREDEAETEAYGGKAEKERTARHRNYGVSSTANGTAIAIENRKKANTARTSAYHSALTTDYSENSYNQKKLHCCPSRDESVTKSRIQKSVHDTDSEKDSHLTSLSEITNSSIKKKDYSSKKFVDSRFSLEAGRATSSVLSSQARQGHIYADKRQTEAERHSLKTSEFLNSRYQSNNNQRKVADVEVNSTNESSLVASLVEEVRRQSIEIEKLRESYQALKSRSELENTSRTEAVMTIEANEHTSASIANLVEELRRQLVEINNLSRSYQELHSSVAYKNDTERLSHSNKLSISDFDAREECATSAMNLVNEERERHIRHDQSRVDRKKVVNSTEIYETDHHRISSSYEVHKTKLRDEEESLTSAIYITEEGKKQHEHKNVTQENFRKLTGSSGISMTENQHNCSLDSAVISQSDDKEQRMTSALHSIEEWREHYANQLQSGEDHQKHSGSVRLPERGSIFGTGPINLSSSRPTDKKVVSKFKRYANQEGKHHQEISTSQQMADTGSRLDSSNSSDLLGSEEIFLEARVLPEAGVILEGNSPQMSVQDLGNNETKTTNILETESGSISSANDLYGNVDLGSVSTQVPMQQTQQLDQINNNGSYNETQDLLESSRLQNESSSLYITEFVSDLMKETSDKVGLDISPGHSLTHMGELNNTEKVNREGEKVNTALQQDMPDVFKKFSVKYTEEGISQSKPLLQTAGPPDEMWDLSGSSQQACQKDEEKEASKDAKEKEASKDAVDDTPENINSGNAVAKRSGRSLWNLIADVIRMNWASNAGKSHKSTTHSGARSSSNESTGSEVWFSGHEPEEDCNDPSKQRKKPSEEESDVTSRHQETAHPFSTKEEECTPPENKDVKKKTGSCTETSKTGGGGFSIVSGKLSLMVDEMAGLNVPSASGIHASSTSTNMVLSGVESGIENFGKVVGLSTSSASGDFTSLASKNTILSSVESGIEKLGKIPVHESVLGSSDHHPLKENPFEFGETGETDGDLRRRKLERNKQVLRDRFDEWEEVHSLETEQRRKDDFFMKEALSEAKKAAESWEVPIGAVLVKNDQIVARSGNMVEECRDSTAHAEIVCIREASKLLKTWRLSETTLYVTLEPCAMCAGAILQARVDTVVWGAPNKLLGADGSWVRLFPGGVEEKPNLDSADQTAGPIHPFHPKITVRRGVLGAECADVMQQFFQLRRKEKKQETSGPSRLHVSKHPTRFFAKMHDVFSMMFCL